MTVHTAQTLALIFKITDATQFAPMYHYLYNANEFDNALVRLYTFKLLKSFVDLMYNL